MTTAPASIRVVICKDGPYLVYGNVPLVRLTIGTDADEGSDKWIAGDTLPTEEQPYALCRCGQSDNKPLCDGTHVAVNFRE